MPAISYRAPIEVTDLTHQCWREWFTLVSKILGTSYVEGSGEAALPAVSVVTETSFDQLSSVGVSARFAREDHTHGTPASPATGDLSIPPVDHSAIGPQTISFQAGASITVMDLVVLDSSSQWIQSSASPGSNYMGILGISLQSKTAGQVMLAALPGTFVRDDSWNWTPGVPLYISETAAAITASQPVTPDSAIRVVGFALTADVIYFNPSPDYLTHV